MHIPDICGHGEGFCYVETSTGDDGCGDEYYRYRNIFVIRCRSLIGKDFND